MSDLHSDKTCPQSSSTASESGNLIPCGRMSPCHIESPPGRIDRRECLSQAGSVLLAGLLGSATNRCLAETEPRPGKVSGDAIIRGGRPGDEIVIRTTDRLAGAIHSVRWQNQEFIDSADHGRQLQSACSFDLSQPGEFWAECYNPTEAGSRADGAGATSSSRLLSLRHGPGWLETESRMAFWLRPGEKSAGRPALNQAILSEHRLWKRVRIGYRDLPQLLDYQVRFTIPNGELHRYAQFEALTGYMPPAFSRFESLDPAGEPQPLDDGPGEQSQPVLFSTPSGSHAIGIFSPDQPSKGFEQAGYGRFRFPAEKVVKWNCVFRIRHATQVPADDYTFQMFVPIGTRDEVLKTLRTLRSLTKR